MSFFLGTLVAFLVGAVIVILSNAKTDAEVGGNVAPLGCGAIIAGLVLAGVLILFIEAMR